MSIETQKTAQSRETLTDSFHTILEGVAEIDPHNQEACLRLLEDNLEGILRAPGSRYNHQAWEGGCIGHIAETFRIGKYLMDLYPDRELPFERSDFFLVMFLHDIEKIFAYDFDDNGGIVARDDLKDKKAKKRLRAAMITAYNFDLNDVQKNALRYVEGVPDSEYSQKGRVMNELAALCHAADMLSARLWHEYPRV